MKLLALDLSKTRTGWAVWHDGWEKPQFGSWVLGSEYTADGRVFAKLHEHMLDLRAVIPFDEIHYEQPINPAKLQGFTNINVIKMAIGLASHVLSFAAATGCRASDVHIDTWRIDFVGSGEISQIKAAVRAKARAAGKKLSARDDLKEATMERCRQLGMKPRYNDEADAIGIADYVLGTQRITPPWRAQEVLRPALGVSR